MSTETLIKKTGMRDSGFGTGIGVDEGVGDGMSNGFGNGIGVDEI